MFSPFLALLPFIIGQVFAADVFVNLPITNVTVAPDGFPRQAIQAGTFPGMNIAVQKGDTLHINVTMDQMNPGMRRSTSIHWHGLFQMRTGSEDGPSFVNQCPIPNEMFYQYLYDIPLNNQTGTFWFHSHLSTQYVDGERGTLVIYPDDPLADLYDVDDASTIITLADWYHSFAEGLMDQFRIDGVTPPAVLGSHQCVVQGKRYRFRVINISAYGAYVFSIDDHVFQVIETDGIETVPLTVTSFEIYVAQRYSIILTADQPVNNYWIRAPIDIGPGNNPDLNPDLVRAVLRYVGAPDEEPTTSALVAPVTLAKGSGGGGGGGGGNGGGGGQAGPLQEFQLATLVDPGAPGGDVPADQTIVLDFNAAGPGVWEINGIVYVPPTLPTLLKVINGATVASDFNTSEHTFVLEPNQIIELQIHGSDHGITHPFHLHGHAFDIVKSTAGPMNFVNPPRRDVIAVDQGGVIIRFRADNPGPWFLHCHIDWHLEAGLAVVFAEDPVQMRVGNQSEIIKPQWLDLCPAYYAQPADLQ
ncbi:laccase 17 [Mycena alexandri]|uniref:Laccase 17 n=1 Tax=Mycena alexandri TaxID=1745969 RepID=A0AAD6X8I2_9AGAR|nr:laccase 17 [Mycena alexandri]